MPSLLPLKLEFLSGWQALLLYLALAIPTFWLGARSMAGIAPIRKWTAVGLRLDLLMLLVLLLAGAQWTQRIKDLSVIAVRDVSRSTQNVISTSPGGIQNQITDLLKTQTRHKPIDDRVGMVAFDGSPWVDILPGLALGNSASAIRNPVDGTNIAQALQLALAVSPPDTLHRLVLFSDGNGTTGDLDQAIKTAASQHVPIDVVPLRYAIEHEIAIEKLEAPSSQKEGTPFTLDVVMHSQNPDPVRARLTITDNGSPLIMDRKTSTLFRDCTLAPGENVEHLHLPPQPVGSHNFHASIEPLDGPATDTISQNNMADAMTLVLGKSRVLYVAGPHLDPTQPLREALISRGIEVDEVEPNAAPRSVTQLQQYTTVVLANVPLSFEGLDQTQVGALETYVTDLGGGLVTVGGPDSYGAGGYIGSRLEKLLPVDCSPPVQRVMPAGALIIIIDCSGSMAETLGRSSQPKVEAADESAVLALQSLSPKDQVGVLAFNDSATWIVNLGLNDHPQSIAASIRAITASGNTDFYPPLKEASLAMSRISPQEAPVRHVLLLTDGYADPGECNKLIAEMAGKGITLSTVGIGNDIDEPLLRKFARDGKGRFYRVADPLKLPQIFVKEAMTLRSSLIREEPFTPRLRAGNSSLVAGITQLPQLLGMVRTWPKPSPMVQVPIMSDSIEPILADWQVGLGRVASFTSDAERRWAPDWVGSPMFSKLWAQTVTGVSRSAMSNAIDAKLSRTPSGQMKLSVETADENSDSPDLLGLSAQLFGPDNTPRPIKLIKTGPGTYEAQFAASDPGAYLATVWVSKKGSAAGWTAATTVVDGSAEWNALQSDEATLHDIANRTGGRFIESFDANINLFDHGDLQPRSAALPITDQLLELSMLTLLLDVAVRRIAFDRQTIATTLHWTANYIRSFTQTRVPHSAAAVTALRSVRETMIAKPEPEFAVVTAPATKQSPQPERKTAEETTATDSFQRLAAAKKRARENRNL